MPLISAVIYHTYAHIVHPAALEWTRLIELPFICAELIVIVWSRKRGFDDASYWRAMSRDLQIAAAALVIGLLASSIFLSKSVPYSLTLSLFTLVHCRFALAVHYLAVAGAKETKAQSIDQAAYWISAGLVSLVVITAVKFAFPLPQPGPDEMVAYKHALPGFISVRHFGSWFGAMAAALGVAVLFSKARGVALVDLLFALAFGVTFWTGTRAALLAIIAVCLWMALSAKGWPQWRALAKLIGLAALGAICAIPLLPPDPVFMMIGSQDYSSSAHATAGRLEMWTQSFEAWLASPIFGWGSGSTIWMLNVGWMHTQPHNALLQFLLSWGLVGTLGAGYLMGRALWCAHFGAINDANLRPVLAMVYALLAMSMLSGTLYYPRFIIMIVGGLAVLLALSKSSKAPATA